LVLVIPEPTRLFRNVDAARKFLDTYDIPIFSMREGRLLGRRALLNAIAKGEAAVQNIRKGTSDALAQRKAEGVVFSDQSGRIKAAQASTKARKENASRIVLDIVRVMLTVPDARSLSHEAFAELLNQQGILTGQKKLWTKDGVRRPRKSADAILAEREEIADDDSIGIPLDHTGQQMVVADQPAMSTVPVDPENLDDPEAEMRKLPAWGMF
jgi:hypothetical protein